MITFRKFWTWALCASAATALVVAFVGVLANAAQARNVLQFAPTWVLLISPPKPTDCDTLGWPVIGPSGEVFNASTVEALPDSLGAELTPLDTGNASRLFCDGYE